MSAGVGAGAGKTTEAARESGARLGTPGREMLRSLKLLPPEAGESMEVQLGTWWLTRIGALILVMGGVFFGVYVSANATPAVRLAELVAGIVAAGALGLWLERRQREFGGVLFGAALAMLFFSAFAAYAIKPVKVLESAGMGAAWQFVVAAGIVGAALWRNSPVIATMATLCGFVACIFSFVQGFENFALMAALVLSAGALALGVLREWMRPQQVSVPLAYVVYAGVMAGWMGPPREAPGFWGTICFPLTTMALFIAGDWDGRRRGVKIEEHLRKLLMVMNTSAAIGLGLVAVLNLHADRVGTFYFAFGAAMLGAAGLYWRTRPGDGLFHLFFVKGTALVTLGLITELEARTRWVAIAVESLVLLVSARRSRRKLIEFLAWATWGVSFLFYLAELLRVLNSMERPGVWTVEAMSATGYVLFSTWLACVMVRWMRGEGAGGEAAGNTLGRIAGEDPVLRVTGAAIVAVLAGIGGVLAVVSSVGETNRPLGWMVLTVLIVGAARFGGHWAGWLAGGMPLLAAHLGFRAKYRLWGGDNPRWIDSAGDSAFVMQLWMNGAAVVGLTLAGALALDLLAGRRGAEGDGGGALDASDASGASDASDAVAGDRRQGMVIGAALLHAVWMFALMTALFDVGTFDWYLIGAVVVAGCVAAGATVWRSRHLADLAVLPLAIALWDLSLGRHEVDGRELVERLREPGTSAGVLVAAAAGGYAFAVGCHVWSKVRERFALLGPGEAYGWLQLGVASGVGLGVMRALVTEDVNLMWVVAGVGGAMALLARWPGMVWGAAWGVVHVLVAHALFYRLALEGAGMDAAVGRSVAAAGVTLGLAAGARGLVGEKVGAAVLAGAQGALGGLGMLMLMVLFEVQKGTLAMYTTPLWGVSAVVVFALGLGARVRPLRIVSLVALAWCVARIFLVDASSALQRIYAFIGVGAVLMVVAFLYHRFRDRIQQIK